MNLLKFLQTVDVALLKVTSRGAAGTGAAGEAAPCTDSMGAAGAALCPCENGTVFM